MPRSTASRSPCLASSGRCSPIFSPGAAAISLYGPPFSWPGFKSHKSMVLGPPFIHSRMQLFFGFALVASAASASCWNQPDTPTPRPTAPVRKKCRRLSVDRAVIGELRW